MNLSSAIINRLSLVFNCFIFLKNNFAIIFGLGLVAAFGRVIQLRGFGEVDPVLNIVLEVIIEGSRILMFLFVLGTANVKQGFLQIRSLFSKTLNRSLHWSKIRMNFKSNWRYITLNMIGFLVVAGILNFLIDSLAYETCLFLSLKERGILVEAASEWTILLFFKNILVIPFTLVFETLFILWLTDKKTTIHGTV